jgi:ATP-dependent Clp protease adapter protein ClpS
MRATLVTPFPLVPKNKVGLTSANVKKGSPPYYKLVLHKNTEFEHKHVSKVIHHVIKDMSIHEAQDKTTEAYLMGKSLLRVCPENVAKEYCDKIVEENVSVTLEELVRRK